MRIFDDIGKFLGKAAPMLASALPGPLGGMAKAALKGVFGLGDDATDDDIKQSVMNMTGEQFIALKKAEQDFAVRMKELDINSTTELERINAQDRESARKMQIAVKDWVVQALAVFTTAGFFGLLLLLVYQPIPEGSKAALDIMLGSLGTAWISIITFYFGSSRSSQKKDEAIAKLSST